MTNAITGERELWGKEKNTNIRPETPYTVGQGLRKKGTYGGEIGGLKKERRCSSYNQISGDCPRHVKIKKEGMEERSAEKR